MPDPNTYTVASAQLRYSNSTVTLLEQFSLYAVHLTYINYIFTSLCSIITIMIVFIHLMLFLLLKKKAQDFIATSNCIHCR